MLKRGHFARYLSTGHLVFARSGTLYAVPFDAKRLVTQGREVPVVQNISTDEQSGYAAFAVSANGSLVYVPGRPATLQPSNSVAGISRTGEIRKLSPDLRDYSNPRVSPDGRKVALEVFGDGTAVHIWIMDAETGAATQLTFDGEENRYPVWTADGRDILFTSKRGTSRSIYRKAADGSGEERLVLDGTALHCTGLVASRRRNPVHEHHGRSHLRLVRTSHADRGHIGHHGPAQDPGFPSPLHGEVVPGILCGSLRHIAGQWRDHRDRGRRPGRGHSRKPGSRRAVPSTRGAELVRGTEETGAGENKTGRMRSHVHKPHLGVPGRPGWKVTPELHHPRRPLRGAESRVRSGGLRQGVEIVSPSLRVFVALGCLATMTAASAQSVAFAPTSTRLTLIGPENLESGYLTNLPQSLAQSRQDQSLMAECGQSHDARLQDKALMLPALMMISRTGVRLVLDRIERRMQAELQKYSAVYRAQADGLFYRYEDANGQPLLRYNCLRITRLPAGSDDGAAEMDLLFRLRLTPQGDGMELTPLRLHLARAAAHTDDGRVNLSVGLSAQAVWRDATVGRSSEIFDEIIFNAGTISGTDAAATRYFAAGEVAPVLLPIIPISTGVDASTPYGYARLAATVAETAVPPASLEGAIDLLARRRDAISIVLLRACETRLQALLGH